jgi:hypothetical protein
MNCVDGKVVIALRLQQAVLVVEPHATRDVQREDSKRLATMVRNNIFYYDRPILPYFSFKFKFRRFFYDINIS